MREKLRVRERQQWAWLILRRRQKPEFFPSFLSVKLSFSSHSHSAPWHSPIKMTCFQNVLEGELAHTKHVQGHKSEVIMVDTCLVSPHVPYAWAHMHTHIRLHSLMDLGKNSQKKGLLLNPSLDSPLSLSQEFNSAGWQGFLLRLCSIRRVLRTPSLLFALLIVSVVCWNWKVLELWQVLPWVLGWSRTSESPMKCRTGLTRALSSHYIRALPVSSHLRHFKCQV